MNATEFRNSEALRTRLAEVLSDPTLKQALAILAEEAEPATTGDAESNQVLAISRFHRAAGANGVIRGLERLTRANPESKTPPVRKLVNVPRETDTI